MLSYCTDSPKNDFTYFAPVMDYSLFAFSRKIMPPPIRTQQEVWNFVGDKNTKEWMTRQKWREKYQPTLAHELEKSVQERVSPVPKSSSPAPPHPPHKTKHKKKKTTEGAPQAGVRSEHNPPPQKLFSRQLLPATHDFRVPKMHGKAICHVLSGGTDPAFFTMTESEEHRLYPNFYTDTKAPGFCLLQKADRTYFRKKDDVKRHLDEVANMARLGVMR